MKNILENTFIRTHDLNEHTRHTHLLICHSVISEHENSDFSFDLNDYKVNKINTNFFHT